jgi:RND family efflux transporter MFP subunit
MKRKNLALSFLHLVLFVLILAAGVVGMKHLQGQRQPPLQAERQEQVLSVEVLEVQEAGPAPVILKGYGEIRSRSVLTLPAEVAGRVTATHPDLRLGAVIPKGAVLYRINDQDLLLEKESAQARLKHLKKEWDLAHKEFTRLSALYQQNRVGNLSAVEHSERSVNAISSQIIQMEQAIKQADVQLSRSVIKAPFTGRITELFVEENAYVTPGKSLLTLSDDRDLEIHVPLRSHEAIQWLGIQEQQDGGWFALPSHRISGTVRWTENEAMQTQGSVDRILRLDSSQRSLVLALRLEPPPASQPPLVPGMFCQVHLEGPALQEVVILPRQAVHFQQTVWVVEEGRLHTRPVEVARIQGDQVLVQAGLKAGELVVTTRLENPLEKSLVRISGHEKNP